MAYKFNSGVLFSSMLTEWTNFLRDLMDTIFDEEFPDRDDVGGQWFDLFQKLLFALSSKEVETQWLLATIHRQGRRP